MDSWRRGRGLPDPRLRVPVPEPSCDRQDAPEEILDPFPQKMLTQGSQMCLRFGLAGEGA